MRDSRFAQTPPPPYYAVIFSAIRSDGDHNYASMADRMVALASEQPGYLGMETARNADGFGITVSYWQSREAIAAWSAHAEHRVAQETGKKIWYTHFEIRVATVERAHGMHAIGGQDVSPK